jgi:hypothetical protein
MLDRLTWRIGFIAAAALAVVLFVGFATQTIRIEGLRLWPLHVEGFKQALATVRLDLDAIKRAQELAGLKAAQAKAQAEADYREKAERTDAIYESRLADANARADAYARRMRVEAPAGARGGPAAAATRDAAEGTDGPGADAYVAVSRPDFDLLTANTLRLQAAHEWACGLDGVKCPPEGPQSALSFATQSH